MKKVFSYTKCLEDVKNIRPVFQAMFHLMEDEYKAIDMCEVVNGHVGPFLISDKWCVEVEEVKIETLA